MPSKINLINSNSIVAGDVSRADQQFEQHNQNLRHQMEQAEDYMRERGYTIEQLKGQRISVLSKSKTPPGKECEVFLGHLPRDLYENELLPWLEKCGRIYEIRLMMDFGLTNRGFGFACYMSSQEAEAACTKLNQTPIRPGGENSGVLRSFDNKRLFLSNLPLNLTEATLMKEVERICGGVESVQIFERSPDSTTQSAYVNFKSHTAATQARRHLVPGEARINNHVVKVEWAAPEKSSSPSRHQQQHNQQHNQQQSRQGRPTGPPRQRRIGSLPVQSNRQANINTLVPLGRSHSNRQLHQIQNAPPQIPQSSLVQTNVPISRPPLVPLPPIQDTSPNMDLMCLQRPNELLPLGLPSPLNPISAPRQLNRENHSSGQCALDSAPLPIVPFELLGSKAQELMSHSFLENNNSLFWNNNYDSRSSSINDISINSFRPDRTIVIKHIDFSLASMEKLRTIFELAGKCSTSKMLCFAEDLIIEYDQVAHARLILEAIIVMPACFKKIAAKDQIITAEFLENV